MRSIIITGDMPVRGFDDKYYESLTRTISEVEERTSAEIVVAIEPCSGNYHDVDLGFGALCALAGLLFLIFSPWSHPDEAIVADLILFFALGAWISSAFPAVRRVLTRPSRREIQARQAAAATFYQENVWTTHDRTGLLLYVSLLERQLLVLADRGVTGAVEPRAWNSVVTDLRRIGEAPDPPGHLIEGLKEVGDLLEKALPSSPGHPHELPNKPRVHLHQPHPHLHLGHTHPHQDSNNE